MSFYHWLGRETEDLLPPECDGDYQDMETIEADGWITCHFSGPIRPLGGWQELARTSPNSRRFYRVAGGKTETRRTTSAGN